MNKWKEQISNIKLLILNIIIVILAILLVVVFVVAAEELYSAFSDDAVGEDAFIYAMEEERYGDLVEYYYRNNVEGDKTDPNMQEYYGVAWYFEAAFYYKMYEEAGETARAAEQKERMEKAVQQLGDFHFMEGKINETLELESSH